MHQQPGSKNEKNKNLQKSSYQTLWRFVAFLMLFSRPPPLI
jgi:hypothetical protein